MGIVDAATPAPQELQIHFFCSGSLRRHGFEVKIDGESVIDPALPQRSAKMVALLILWDLVTDCKQSAEDQRTGSRTIRHDEIQKRFAQNKDQAIKQIRQSRLKIRFNKTTGSNVILNFTIHDAEVDVLTFYWAVKNKDSDTLRQYINNFGSIFPDTWLLNDYISSKEKQLLDKYANFEYAYLETLETKLLNEMLGELTPPMWPHKLRVIMAIKYKEALSILAEAGNTEPSPESNLTEPIQLSSIGPLHTSKDLIPSVSRVAETSVTPQEVERICRLANQANDDLNGPKHNDGMNRLACEGTRLQEVFEWCLADAAYHKQALHLAQWLWEFWYIRGLWSEARIYLQQVLALPANQDPVAVRGYVLNGVAVLALANFDKEEALNYLRESLNIAGSKDVEGGAYNTLGWAATIDIDANIQQAKMYYEKALINFEAAGNNAARLWPLRGLGNCFLDEKMRDYRMAQQYLKRALDVGEEYMNIRGQAFVHGDHAVMKLQQRDFNNAYSEYKQSLKLWKQVEEEHSFAICVEGVARLANQKKYYSTAVTLYIAAQTLRKSIGVQPWIHEQKELEREIEILRIRLVEQFADAEDKGKSIGQDMEQIIEFVDELM